MQTRRKGRVRTGARRWIVPAVVTAVSIPMVQGFGAPALAAIPPGSFACDSADGMWQKLVLDENHDNLFARVPAGATAVAGKPFTFELVWEWRDWRPGATLHIRHCLDVDTGAAVDGKATAPFDDLGGNPPDVSVVQPLTEPTDTVMKLSEVRPAVVMPFKVTIPTAAPAGSEVCIRSAILADAVEHQHSPPVYDIAETVCVPVSAPPTPPAPPPTPSPSPSPSPGGAVSPASETPAPPPTVQGARVLPRTGVSLTTILFVGGLLLLAGGLIAWRVPRPFFLLLEELETPRRRGS